MARLVLDNNTITVVYAIFFLYCLVGPLAEPATVPTTTTSFDIDDDILPDKQPDEQQQVIHGPDWTLYEHICPTDDSTVAAHLPKFANAFELRAEVKWSTTNAFDSSFEITGYYDRQRHRGATVIVREDIESRFLYDFPSSKAFVIDSRYPYYCSSSQNLYDMACSPYALYIMEEAGYETIRDKCQMQATKISRINSTGVYVRDFPVNIYRQCVWMNTTASDSPNGSYWLIEYLFSDDTVTGRVAPAPLRLNVTRLDMSGAYSALKPRQLYDFFSYLPHVGDKSVFEPPAGVHCHDWPAPNNGSSIPFPVMPEQFSLTTLTTSSERPKDILHTKLSIDNRIQAAIVNTDGPRWTQPAVLYNGGLMRRPFKGIRRTVVYDFNTRFWFDLAHGGNSEQQCLAVRHEPLAMNTKPNDALSNNTNTASYTDELIRITLDQARTLYTANRLRFTYMGLRTLGGSGVKQRGESEAGPLVHMWIATKKFEDMAPGEHVTVELYFYDTEPSSSPGQHQYVPAAIALYRFAESHRTLNERTMSIVSSFSDEPLVWHSFNISQCLRATNNGSNILANSSPDNLVLTLKLTQPGANATELIENALNGKDKGNSLRIAIANKMNVSALRVDEMSLVVDPLLVDHIKFTLHGWPTTDDGSESAKEGVVFFNRMRHVEPTVSDAVARLNASLSVGDLPVVIPFNTLSGQRATFDEYDGINIDVDQNAHLVRRSHQGDERGGANSTAKIRQNVVFIVRNSLRTVESTNDNNLAELSGSEELTNASATRQQQQRSLFLDKVT